MGVPVTTRLTVHDFMRLPEEQTRRAELVDGEVVQMGTAGRRHEKIKSNLMLALVPYLARMANARLFSETMFDLAETESRIPDVSVLLDEPSRGGDPDEHYKGAPDIAIEVVSSESAAFLNAKVRAYMQYGGKEVWVLYPEAKEVFLYTADDIRRYSATEELETPTLPGFRVLVSKLFE